jgi:hypothetical protein
MTAANDTVAISNLASGPDDGAVRTLAHGRQFGTSTDPFQVTTKLWYDPKTFGITKRTIDAVHGGTRRFVTETFEEFTLNADIPDEKFKLPEEKK